MSKGCGKSVMTVCFFGHRTVTDAAQLKTKLTQTVSELIADGADTFLFGSRSEFDSLCWEVVTELQAQYPHIKRVSYVTPHETAVTSKEQRMRLEQIYAGLAGSEVRLRDYESAVNSQKSQNATKNAYIMRNQEMIDNSDVCVFYYDKNYLPPKRKLSERQVAFYQPQSGTSVAFAYATAKRKTILNLFE